MRQTFHGSHVVPLLWRGWGPDPRVGGAHEALWYGCARMDGWKAPVGRRGRGEPQSVLPLEQRQLPMVEYDPSPQLRQLLRVQTCEASSLQLALLWRAGG